MKRAIVTAALVAALASPAIASDHIAIAFRNPVPNPDTRTVSRTTALVTMVALQAWDALNSANHWRRGWHEANPQYQPFAHGGAPTMLAGMAAYDIAELAAGRALHAAPGSVELYQAEQSVSGILTTNGVR